MITKKGFTLIELLVVIAILAVLAVAVVVVLNPGELLRQARDSTRISDMAALNSAIALYLSDVTSNNWTQSTTTCTSSNPASSTHPFATPGLCSTVRSSTSTVITGAGWVPINFGQISSGAPLAKLPLDPTNDTTYFYASRLGTTASSTYELDANMESTKYAAGGTADVESNAKDGGDNANWYEVGNALAM